MTGERLTYKELAARWGIGLEATKTRVRRSGWYRQMPNAPGGEVLVNVPPDGLKTPPKSQEIRGVSDDMTPLMTALQTALALNENLQSQVKEANAALLRSSDEKAELRESLAAAQAREVAMQANLEAVKAREAGLQKLIADQGDAPRRGILSWVTRRPKR